MAVNVPRAGAPHRTLRRRAGRTARICPGRESSSIEARCAEPGFPELHLVEAGPAGLTELAARALAPRGIRVNGIAPALVLRSPGQSEENFAAMHSCQSASTGRRTSRTSRQPFAISIEARCVTGQVLLLDLRASGFSESGSLRAIPGRENDELPNRPFDGTSFPTS